VVSRAIRCAGSALGSQLTPSTSKAVRHDQEEAERAVFDLFAEAAGLRCSWVESRRPPEPDILCELIDEGRVAFELGEVVNPLFERAINEQRRVRDLFRAAYEARPDEVRERIEACLGGPPAVFIGFRSDVLPGRWRHAVVPVLDVLAERAAAAGDERLRPGEVPAWRDPRLSELLSDMSVGRASHGKAFFGVVEMVEVVDATTSALKKKFGRRYRTAAPIELVIYWAASPAPPTPPWRDALLALIQEQQPASPFRRVWCFDLFKSAVVLVHPPR
jgi:hypothetical protein